MSSQGLGYFFTPQDGDTPDSIKRRQAYAKMLQDQGAADPGNTPYGGLASAGKSIAGALLGKSADQAQSSNYQQLLANTLGQPKINPVTVTPQVSADNPAGSDSRQAAYNSPAETYNGPLAQGLGQNKTALLAQMLQGIGPEQGTQMLQSAAMQAVDNEDKRMTPMTAQQMLQRGYRPGTVGSMDAFGNEHVNQQSDVQSPEAFQQAIQLHQQQQIMAPEAIQQQQDMLRNRPMTPGEIADNKRADAQIAEARRHNFAEESIAADKGIVDPKAIDLGVSYFLSNGGKMPPTARSLALQQAIMGAARDRMQASGTTMDQLVNKGIGLRAQGAAAAQVGRQQAGTQINEDTVVGGMNILNGLLNKGAASPGNIAGLNELGQWASRQSNNPDAANLYNAVNTISNEYARVMTGQTGGTASSDSARNEAAKRLLLGYNKGTMQAVLGQMHYEMRQRTQAQRGALGQLTGGQFNGVNPAINYADPNAPAAPSRFKIEQVH